MSDNRLRDAERRFRQTRSTGDAVAFMTEKCRQDDRVLQKMRIAAYCGDVTARILVGMGHHPCPTQNEACEGCEEGWVCVPEDFEHWYRRLFKFFGCVHYTVANTPAVLGALAVSLWAERKLIGAKLPVEINPILKRGREALSRVEGWRMAEPDRREFHGATLLISADLPRWAVAPAHATMSYIPGVLDGMLDIEMLLVHGLPGGNRASNVRGIMEDTLKAWAWNKRLHRIPWPVPC